MSDAQSSKIANERRMELARYRQKILGTLFQLAESGPTAAPESATPEAQSDADRKKALQKTLTDLKSALDEHQQNSQKAEEPGEKQSDAQKRTIEAVLKTVSELLDHSGPAISDDPKKIYDRLQKPVTEFLSEWYPIQKILIAVHGIGDQFNFETVQSVAYRVCDYVGQPAAIPLGRFHGTNATITRAYLPDPDRDPPVNCGFAEIYWADVPRQSVKEKYILEEPKKWARTMVERLELRVRRLNPGISQAEKEKAHRENDLIEQVLVEMIQGVVAADRLAFLAEKAGLFHFELKKLLNDYLNDVQVVTEFENDRKKLLEIFRSVMETTHNFFPKSELYIVAHSEGTVVTFMGLLKGLSVEAAWAKQVKGLMTIGSPINKHIRLWPELFSVFEVPKSPRAPQDRIKWKNYYDYGDPIAFNLKSTREWMKMPNHDWRGFFDFEDPADEPTSAQAINTGDDIGFTRYFFPGAAHNDYWQDPDVFGHFFQNVVDPTGQYLTPDPPTKKFKAPESITLAKATSYILPYVLSAALLILGVYILYKAMRACLDPIGAGLESTTDIIRNVLGLSCLFAGMTLVARIPRLTNTFRYRLWVLPAVVFSFAYLFVTPEHQRSIARFMAPTGYEAISIGVALVLTIASVGLTFSVWSRSDRDLPRWLLTLGPMLLTLGPVVALVLILNSVASPYLDRANRVSPGHVPLPLGLSLGVISVSLFLGLIACLVSRRFPKAGLKPLLHTSGMVLALTVMASVSYNRMSAGGHNWDSLVNTLHARASSITDAMVKQRDFLSDARTKLVDEIAKLEKSKDSPDQLQANQAMLNEVDRSIATYTELRNEQKKLDEEIAALATSHESGRKLEDKFAEITKKNEELFFSVLTPQNRQTIADAAGVQIVTDAARIQGPIWPVFLAGAAFLYLWWLSALTFDLTFVWHLYIRYDLAERYFDKRLGENEN